MASKVETGISNALTSANSFVADKKQKVGGGLSSARNFMNEKKGKVLGSVAAIKTLLDRVGSLLSVGGVGEPETSFSFMLNVLSIIGVSEQEIIDWVSKLLAGKGTDGILNGIEEAVKAILLANVKNMFTCSMNPFIPDKLMESTIGLNKKPIGGEGIAIDLDAVDVYGVLNLCPVNDDGKNFYFDAKYSDYSISEDNPQPQGYTVNELWKSRDFNAYLWYVINKGTRIGVNANKLYWDNRIKYLNEFSRDPELRDRFFEAEYGPTNFTANKIGIPIEGSSIVKQQIIRCEYVEHAYHAVGNNMLKVYINPNRYYAARKISYKKRNGTVQNVLWVNKTVFEFNYDYIYSLKLFNSKTLVASVINAVLGLISTVSINFGIKKEINAQKVRSIVNSIILADDNSTGNGAYGDYSDCFYKFSNEEYDKMIEEAIKKHAGVYNYNGVDYEIDYNTVMKAIDDINDAATPEELQSAIANAITASANSIGGNNRSSSMSIGYTENDANVDENYTPYVSLGLDVIKRLLNETVTQIVMQVLSPKVAILFKINSVIMGNMDPQSDGWENFMKDSKTLIVNLVLEVKDMLIKQMMQWLLSELKPFLELFVSRVVLEAVRDYVELLSQLVRLCGLLGGSNYGGNYIGDFDFIDLGDVYGADIIPSDLVNNNPEGKNKKC